MSVGSVAWQSSLRAVPRLAWLFLVLGALVVLRSLVQPTFAPISAIAGGGSCFFAAAVLYVRPVDRPIAWGAIALAFVPTIAVIANVVPNAWFAIAPGDWKNATPLLADLAGAASQVASLIAVAGLYLLAIGLGGVRSFVSFLILGLGAALALANLTWTLAHPIEGFPVLELVRSVAFATLYVLGLAFVFAAAVESLRNLTMVGAGLLFAAAAVSDVLLWWQPGPGTNTDLLSLLLGSLMLGGWLGLVAGALRGEMNDAAVAPRSRAGRGSAARRRGA